MSGGFVRGTSAEQDTRFSNKKAKLLKSQKFAAELDHLVDAAKVKMDVMRPWIANRVTELLGFEDEVLINFIYGLLDGKEVNGKEVQISLTGFMEKNTGKFMKELWTLLLSAQKNVSGVPQQFLDAKEEETKKKKAETDRIATEIQRKKEKEIWELEQEKMKKMDDELDTLRDNETPLGPSLKHQPPASGARSAEEKEIIERNGSRGKSRVSRSPQSADRSPSASRSISKSISNSKSYSEHRSRSLSRSPQRRGRSVSSEGVYRSPPRSMMPRRRHSSRRSVSPPRRRSSYSRRRSSSHSHHISPSPPRHRFHSPPRHRSRSPMQHRSRSPIGPLSRSPIGPRSRSPVRHQSQSPLLHQSRSPVWRRSRSPVRRRPWSPMWHGSRSPLRRRPRPPMRRRSRSPMRRRSRSPMRRRSPSPMRRRYASPMRRRSPSPMGHRSPSPVRRRYRRSPSTPRKTSPSPVRHRLPVRRRSLTPSPEEWSSPSPIRHRTTPPDRRKSPKRQRSPLQSPGERIRTYEKISPVGHALPSETLVKTREVSNSLENRPPVSSKLPHGNTRNRNDSHKKVKALMPSPSRSLSVSDSPPAARRRSPSNETRSNSPYESPEKRKAELTNHGGRQSPLQKPKEHRSRCGSPEISVEKEGTNYARFREDGDQKSKSSGRSFLQSSIGDRHKDSLEKGRRKDEFSPDMSASRSGETRSRPDNKELRKKDQEMQSEKNPGRMHRPEAPVPVQPEMLTTHTGTLSSEGQQESYSGEGYKADERNSSRINNIKGSDLHRDSETVSISKRKVVQNDRSGSVHSSSEESDKHRAVVKEKRKHKRSGRRELSSDDDYSSDSDIEERKEAKRRRKEEKRQRKEVKRRRREERRRRREERRAEKLKEKAVGTALHPLDLERYHDAYASDGERVDRKQLHASDIKEPESNRKKLEIELREKALESLRAKKGIGR